MVELGEIERERKRSTKGIKKFNVRMMTSRKVG